MAIKDFNAKKPVKIRERLLDNGNTSLYLDIYQDKKRKYEFLKLHLVPEKTKAAKEQNRQTLQLAISIQAKRIVEIQNHEYGFADSFKLDTNFFYYYESMAEARKESYGNYGNWMSALNHLHDYASPHTTFKDIDTQFLEGFKTHLAKIARTKSGTPLSANSQHSYYCKLRACINKAFDDRILPHNSSFLSVKAPKISEPQRDYLTVEEVRALSKTECHYPIMKRAFLFSCLTGIRWSDINKMTWNEVQEFDGGTRVVFRQKKTKEQEYLDINPQASDLLGKRTDPGDRVFEGLKYSAYHNVALQKWVMRAGISKNITFHCGRHTFAVMMLHLGADIYTVSKLLGHRDIKTTQIYAQILDKKKQDAVALIPDSIIDIEA